MVVFVSGGGRVGEGGGVGPEGAQTSPPVRFGARKPSGDINKVGKFNFING